jgi:effector-binding domain-containing protein
MITTPPKLEDRNEQNYVGIRTQAHVQTLSQAIPQLLGEVFGWLGQHGIQPAGAPFMRYHVINMSADMDFEIGVPVASMVSGDGRVCAGVIPAGRYASLIYTGVENGIAGNKELIDWAENKGIKWDRWDDKNGDAFRSRVEYFLTDPANEPDPAKWETEVAIKVEDKQSR